MRRLDLTLPHPLRAAERVRWSVLARFTPIALTISIGLTRLQAVTSLRIILLFPLVVLVARSPRRLWAFVLRGPLGLFVAFMTASILWSEKPIQSIYSVGNWAVETLAAIAAVTLGGAIASRYLSVLLKVFLVASAIVAIRLPSVGRMDSNGAPWRGVFEHKNSLGTVAAFAVVIFASTGKPGHRLRWVLLALFLLVAAQSQTALAAALIGLFVQAAARSVYTKRPGREPLPATIFYGALGLAALMLWQVAGIALSVLHRNPTLTGRTTIWSVIIDYGRPHRWVGSGIGAQIYDGSRLAHNIELVRGQTLGTTHNGYLVIYLGLGFIGLVLFAVALMKIFLTIEHARRKPGTTSDQVVLALGLLTCYLVLNMAEDRLLTRSGWFFLMFGVLQLLPRRYPLSPPPAGANRSAAPAPASRRRQ